MDTCYMSARSMANSGSSPYTRVSYLRTSKSGPPNIATALHYSSSEDDDDDDIKNQKFNKTTTISIPTTCIGYGTFVISAAGLPYQAKAMVLYAQSSLQQQIGPKRVLAFQMKQQIGPNHCGMVLGWIMAAIYMGGCLPQIYLNIANSRTNNRCKLTDLSGKGKIVALGRVESTDTKALVHFKPLRTKAVKVWVEAIKEPTAVLWRQTSELQYMENVIGFIVAWPAAHVVIA